MAKARFFSLSQRGESSPVRSPPAAMYAQSGARAGFTLPSPAVPGYHPRGIFLRGNLFDGMDH